MQIIRIGWYKLNTCKHNLYSLLSRLPSILKDAPKYLFITTKKFKFDLKNVEINIDCYIYDEDRVDCVHDWQKGNRITAKDIQCY